MIREDLFKEYDDNCGEPYIEVSVDFEVSNHEPQWANASGTIRLIMDMIEGSPCIVGVSNNQVGVSDQDGGELSGDIEVDKILEHINTQEIEEDPDFDLETLER